jgi:hypothetical protein
MTRTNFLRTFEEIRGLERRTLKEEISPDTIEQWTSYADVQIFSLIESESGIELDNELIAAETVDDLLRGLQNHGAFRE